MPKNPKCTSSCQTNPPNKPMLQCYTYHHAMLHVSLCAADLDARAAHKLLVKRFLSVPDLAWAVKYTGIKHIYSGFEVWLGWDPRHQRCWDPIAKTHLKSRFCAIWKIKGSDVMICDRLAQRRAAPAWLLASSSAFWLLSYGSGIPRTALGSHGTAACQYRC